MRYEDPKHPIKIRHKVACVITSYIPKKPDVYKFSNSDIEFSDNKIDALKFTLAAYEYYNTEIDYEIIIVDNRSPASWGREWLKSLPYKVLWRANEGFSFGGFKHAWKTLGDKYDYYLFHEQDYAPTKNGWLEEILIKFMKGNTGAVGNWLEIREYKDLNDDFKNQMDLATEGRKWMCNLDGSWTFTSSKILKQVDKIGGLRVLPCEPQINMNATVNELAFQQQILELGYDIESFLDGEHRIYQGSANLTECMYPDKPLAPMVNGNTRHANEFMAKHFGWYI